MTTRLLIIIAALLVAQASLPVFAADSRWGWDGGCATCPEHYHKHNASTASWIRLAVQGSAVHAKKTSAPNWDKADAAVAGWTRLGVKIILSTPFHPVLTDAEVLPFRIKFNAAVLARYCTPTSPQYSPAVVGIEPANEPWLDNDNFKLMNDGTRWGYVNNRLGTGVTGSFWRGGIPGPTLDALTPDGIRWLTALRDLHAAVRKVAAPLGVQVYGPHWSNERYTDETRMFKLLGGLEPIDVFTFGCDAQGKDWWTWAGPIKDTIGEKPWAVTEFHLHHAPLGKPDIDHAKDIRTGLQYWRSLGAKFVLVHIGLQSVDINRKYPGDNNAYWQSMAGYIAVGDDRGTGTNAWMTYSLAAVQDVLSEPPIHRGKAIAP